MRWNRGSLKSQRGGKLSIHYNGDLSTAELLSRTIVSVSQLSVHGAISDWCDELAQQFSDSFVFHYGKPVADMNEQLDCRLSPEVLSKPLVINVPAHDERFETLPEDMGVIQATVEVPFLRITRNSIQTQTDS